MLAETPDVDGYTRAKSLSLVRGACHRLKERVSSLHRKPAETPLEDSRNREVANIVYIRDSPPISAGVSIPAMA
jgi:hypothetical protein